MTNIPQPHPAAGECLYPPLGGEIGRSEDDMLTYSISEVTHLHLIVISSAFTMTWITITSFFEQLDAKHYAIKH
jgi:hypothetical protein